MKNITRYAIQRKSDNKFYKNTQAIYLDIEKYWGDANAARLWIYKPDFVDKNLYDIITFSLKQNCEK